MMSSAALIGIGLAVVGFFFIALPRMLPGLLMRFRVSSRLRAEKVERKAHTTDLDAYHHAYHNTVSSGERSSELNDRTWRDLDMDDVFNKIDHTKSRVGQQYLRHMMRVPQTTCESLDKLNRVVIEIEADIESLDRCRTALSKVDDPRAGYLVELILGDLPDRPVFWWVIPFFTFISLASVVWVIFDPRAIIAVVAMCLVNVFTQLRFRRRMDALLSAIHEVPAFIKASAALGALHLDSCSAEIETLRSGAPQLSVFLSSTWWLSFDPAQDARELVTLLYGYANLLLLGDVNAFVFGLNAAKAARPLLQQMFVAMGYIDVAQSIVEMRKQAPKWCLPQLTGVEKKLSTIGLVHPLVVNAVANTLTIDDTSVLITGSNMSGKTTFVRALGVNAVLAQTLNTVFAESWCSPFLAVGASIGRMDNLLEGKSYYLAEVESVGQLVREKGDGRQHLYLLDEIFRGTNTPERIAGAYAVLSHLNTGNDIVVVATHDIELLDMLGTSYAAHHFREHIESGTLTFDFTIRDGSATTRNAIALLEVMNYPPALVATAREALTRRGS